MKHRTKFTKTAAFTLILALVLSLFPTAVLAQNISVISAEAGVQTTNDERLSNDNASGEGYIWNEESKILTITQSTEDYTTSTYKNRPWQQYADTAEKIVIDNSDIYIGNYAFYNFSSVINLEINNCGDIGKYAFQNCLKLENVTIKNCGNIGSYAFGNLMYLSGWGVDESIKTVVIENCGEIGDYAFGALPALESVKIDNCTAIKTGAFTRCSALKSLSIANCSTIGDSAFDYSTSLTSFYLDGCESIGSGILNGSSVESIELENCSTIGDYAFQNCHSLKTLTLTDCGTIGNYSFGGCENLTDVTITNLDTIGEDSFAIHDEGVYSSLTNLTLHNVRYISSGAFENCTKLTSVDLDGCEYLGGNAFSGCTNLTDIVVPDYIRLGYSDIFVNFPDIMARMEAILDGQFDLESAEAIDEILPQGWTSYQIGEQNSAVSYEGDTQLTKETKWSDEDKTIADVLIQAYYTAERQMDFVFVADCSNSMAGIGNDYDMNSKFYDMQSKLLDVTEQLLTTPGYDCKVAYATFGESESSASQFYGTTELSDAQDFITNDIVDYKSNTNYSSGLAQALKLVKSNQGRNTTVIFISDGQPYGGTTTPDSYYGTEKAAAIKAADVQIIGVLQSVSDSEEETAAANMQAICDNVFVSKDTQGFSEAVNDAIANAYGTYTLTDTVDSDFELDESSIQVSAGNIALGEDENGNTTITWTIYGMPFTIHTLSFQEKIKDEDGVYPSGMFDTNEDHALLSDGTDIVNTVATPVLSRGASLTVEKKWNGDSKEIRPESIKVTLLRDGEEYDTREIGATQNWTYTWEGLDEAYQWSVQETDVPEGYTSDITHSGQNWIITNTYINTRIPETHVPNDSDTNHGNMDAPPTGDNKTVIYMWGTIMLLAAGSLIGFTVLTVKKKNRF
ncbi:MAG: leucine-rich repeat protein [Clostridium sp.]|nr:leucine-rich repeat protein [Clostridium sp.]